MSRPSSFAARPRSRFLFGLFLAISAPLSACCTDGQLSTTGIAIARGVRFDLLPPASLGRALSLEQRIEARRGAETSSFHCVLEVDARELVLVGLTPLGTRAFVVTLDAQGLRVESASGRELPADPARILADLELALWPIQPLIGGIGSGIGVVERDDGTGAPVREILHDGRPVIRITYQSAVRWQGELRLEHLEQDYTLLVRTLRAEDLGEHEDAEDAERTERTEIMGEMSR